MYIILCTLLIETTNVSDFKAYIPAKTFLRKTLMIVNVSPSKECQKETERTLEFGREVHLQNNFIFFNIDYYNYINLLC